MTNLITQAEHSGLRTACFSLVGHDIVAAAATILAGHALCSLADRSTMAHEEHIVPYSIVNVNFVELIMTDTSFMDQVESTAKEKVLSVMTSATTVKFEKRARRVLEYTAHRPTPGGECILRMLLSTPYIASGGDGTDACYYIKQFTSSVSSSTKCSRSWVPMDRAKAKVMIWENLCRIPLSGTEPVALKMPGTWMYRPLPSNDTDSNGQYTTGSSPVVYDVCLPILESTGTGHLDNVPTHITTADPEPPGGFVEVHDVKRARTERKFVSYLQMRNHDTQLRRRILRTTLATKLDAYNTVLFSMVQCTGVHTTTAMCTQMAWHLWHHTWFCMFGRANTVMCQFKRPSGNDEIKRAAKFIYDMHVELDDNLIKTESRGDADIKVKLQYHTPPFHVPVLVHVVFTFCNTFSQHVYSNTNIPPADQYIHYCTAARNITEDFPVFNAMRKETKHCNLDGSKTVCNSNILLTKVRCVSDIQSATDFTLELSDWDYLNLARDDDSARYVACTTNLLRALESANDADYDRLINDAIASVSGPVKMYSKLFWKTFAQCQAKRIVSATDKKYVLEPPTRTDVLVSNSVKHGMYLHWKKKDDTTFAVLADVVALNTSQSDTYDHTLHDGNTPCSIATLSRYHCNISDVLDHMVSYDDDGVPTLDTLANDQKWYNYLSLGGTQTRNTLYNPWVLPVDITLNTPPSLDAPSVSFQLDCTFDGYVATPAYKYHTSANTTTALSESKLILSETNLKRLTD